MSDPVLSYAAPASHWRSRLAVTCAILLWLWCTIDLFFGFWIAALACILAPAVAAHSPGFMGAFIALFIPLGLTLFVFGLRVGRDAIRIWRGAPRAASRAYDHCLTAEFCTYVALCLVLPLAILDEFWRNAASVFNWTLVTFVSLSIPLLVTFTRVLLRRLSDSGGSAFE